MERWLAMAGLCAYSVKKGRVWRGRGDRGGTTGARLVPLPDTDRSDLGLDNIAGDLHAGRTRVFRGILPRHPFAQPLRRAGGSPSPLQHLVLCLR